MLRIKKPQPKSLSRYLTNRWKVQFHWKERLTELTDWHIPIANHEDFWDEMMIYDCGIQRDDPDAPMTGRLLWRYQAHEAKRWLENKLDYEFRRRVERAIKYKKIIAEETKLAKKEQYKRRMVRRKARKVAAAAERKNMDDKVADTAATPHS